MDIPLDEVVYFDIVTHNPTTGGISAADSTPTFDVYEEASDTGMLGSTNFTVRTALTGSYRGTFTASAANGFEAGKWYSVIATATVASTQAKKVCLGFRLAIAETTVGSPNVALSTTERATLIAALYDLANGIETGMTPRQAQRIILSAAAGKISGAATPSLAIRDVNDTKDRIVGAVDGSGNRTSVTLDAT